MTTNSAPGLAVRTDCRLIRAAHHSTRYALVEIAAPSASDGAVRPRVNVAFVLDRSGSMGGPKIDLARRAVREGIERLAADDRFAVVAYDDRIDVVAASRMAAWDAKRDAIRALESIDARGQTNLGDGWLRGAEQVATELDPAAVNRVLLLTDGLANQGMTDPAQLIGHAAELRARGISTSTFGLGDDFDERLLGGMADSGGGAFRFIGRAEQIPELIGSEVGELLEVTARGVALRIAGPDGIRIEPLSTFAFDRSMHEGTLHVGDLVADQVVRAVVALTFPLGELASEAVVKFTLRSETLSADTALAWTFAADAANEHQSRDRDVDRVVARFYADRALRDAVDFNRRGEWEQARQRLRSVARRIRDYAAGDPILLGIVAELERESEAWARPRIEEERKVRYAASAYALRSRSQLGAAERRERE
jgi:Ca-activated chloride channel family protein